MEELNTLLASLAQEGRHHSAGEFTISLEHAAEKLAAYRLADPALFVLNLVACAVTSGADSFTVTTDNTGLSLRFNTFAGGHEVLPELFAYILETGAPPYLRELALAVHGAQSLPDQPRISLFLGTKDSYWRADIQGRSVTVAPDLESEPRRGLEMRLSYSDRPAWTTFFSKTPESSGRILDTMFHFCRFAPLAVSLNGVSKGSMVNLAVHDESTMAWRYLRGTQELRVSRPGRRRTLFTGQRQESGLASSMVLALTKPEVATETGLLIISRGVAFYRPAQLLGCDLACAAVTADHLEKNLSQSDLAEGPEYKALIGALRQEVKSLLVDMCEDLPLLTVTQKLQLGKALEAAFRGQEVPASVEMFHRFSALQRDCLSPSKLDDNVRFALENSSKSKVAKQYREELSKVLEDRLGQLLLEREWKGALGLVGKLNELAEGRGLVGLGIVLAVLANQRSEALEMYKLSCADRPLSPALLLLCELVQEVESDESHAVDFARLERAVWRADFVEARLLALGLESQANSAFLNLYLGLFWAHLSDMASAELAWARALNVMDESQSMYWWPVLWKRLRGRLPFAAEVRWQVKNAYLNTFRGQPLMGPKDHLRLEMGWLMELWDMRAFKDLESTKYPFLNSYLYELIDPGELRIKEPGEPGLRVSLFKTW